MEQTLYLFESYSFLFFFCCISIQINRNVFHVDGVKLFEDFVNLLNGSIGHCKVCIAIVNQV